MIKLQTLKRFQQMKDRQKGFTLIEIMVVIAIISLSISLILGTNNGDAQKLTSIKNSLENDFSIARNEALLTHNMIIWQADEKGYRFSKMEVEEGGSGWQLKTINRKNLKPKQWQNGITWAYKEENEWRLVTKEESRMDYLDDSGEMNLSDEEKEEIDALMQEEYQIPVRMMFSADGRVISSLPIRLYLNDKQIEFNYGVLPKPNDEKEKQRLEKSF